MTLQLDAPSTYLVRPRYEGANIRTWVGFKHLTYLVEEAVLEHFRERELGPGALYHRFALGLEFIESSIQLPATLDVDDTVSAIVMPGSPGSQPTIQFAVKLIVQRAGAAVTVLTGKVRIALVAEREASAQESVPDTLSRYTVSSVDELTDPAARLEMPGEPRDVLVPHGSNGYLCTWRIPYYYCHFSDRLQHSGYVRAVEEVVDRFLADRGLSIRAMLDTRSWIPVVSRVRLRLLADARMEEVVHTVFTVRDIVKDVMYTATVDFYVQRDNHLIRTATGSILHGYAISRGPDAGSLARFDDDVRSALLGGAA